MGVTYHIGCAQRLIDLARERMGEYLNEAEDLLAIANRELDQAADHYREEAERRLAEWATKKPKKVK